MRISVHFVFIFLVVFTKGHIWIQSLEAFTINYFIEKFLKTYIQIIFMKYFFMR